MTKGRYLNTELGKIPEEWVTRKFHEILVTVKGSLPNTLVDSEESEKLLPYLSAEYLRGKHEKAKYCLIEDPKRITIVDNDDILVIWDGSNAGEFLLGKKGVLSSTMAKVTFKDERLSRKFIYYFLKKCEGTLKNTTKGSTIPHVDGNKLQDINLLLPTLPEQQKIAEIISTADDAIQKVNEQIALTKQLKKDMMQKLLTRGIGHFRFRETEIGEIPEEWAVQKLEEVAILRKEQINPRNYAGEVYLGLEHITPGEPKIISYGNPNDVTSSKWKFHSGDILYGKLRPYLDKAVIADRDGICSTDIHIIIPEKVDPNFLLYMLHTKRLIKHSTSASVGTNHPRISWEILKDFEIPLPPNEEQIRISEILTTIDDKIVFLQDKGTLLERLKKGLMEDLLTGKIRVKV